VRGVEHGLSQTAYAKRRGVSQQAVSKQVKRGRIQLLADGTIDPAQADAAWPLRTGNGHRPSTTTTTPAHDTYDPRELEKARAEKTRLEAKLRALELRLREGALVDRAVVIDRVLGYVRRARDQWLAWPARIGAELADELGVDRLQVTAALEDRVHAQLEALAADVFDLPAAGGRLAS
jgi:hypothetical protein